MAEDDDRQGNPRSFRCRVCHGARSWRPASDILHCPTCDQLPPPPPATGGGGTPFRQPGEDTN